MEETRPTIRIWELLISVGGFVILMFYAVTAFSSEDLMWFWPQSDAQEPSRIVIHKQGQELVISSDMPEFAPLAQAAARAFSRVDTPELIEVGLSDITLGRYWTASNVVEFFYEEPLQFHVPFRAGNPTQILFPIDGPHSDKGWFFRGSHDEYWFGAMRIQDPQSLLDALKPYVP